MKEAANPPAAAEAARRIDHLNDMKQNSLLGEFAKRAFLIKAAGGFQNESPASVLFRQLTDYFVSRDIPGCVGPGWRCKTVADVRQLKSELGSVVAKRVAAVEKRERLFSRPWKDAYKLVLKGLQST
jgi:hypothetical protein